MAVLQANASVLPGNEVRVTGPAGEAFERSGETESVALGDPPGPANVLAGAFEVSLASGLRREPVEALDALVRYLGFPACHCSVVGRLAGNSYRFPAARRPLARPIPRTRRKSGTPLAGCSGANVVRALNYLELAGRLERSGIGTSVKHQREALAATGVEVFTSPWNGGDPVRAGVSKLSGECYFTDVDVVHCNMIGPGSVATARHALRTETPLVLHAHVTREDFRNSFRGSNVVAPALGRYLRWFYSQADLVLCPSEYTKGVLESYPIDAPIRPITNGIDLGRLEGFEGFGAQYREEYDVEGMGVFAVGNVFERKGLSTFCRVAQETPYDFTWYGTYDSGPQASATVRKWTRNPPENVTFSGWVDDIRGAYAAGDVFMFPAKVENQGIVVLEAMACGKAVVLSDIPVFQEFYEDGHDCLICSSETEFSEALDRLEQNPELRERLGENARETAAEHGLDRVGSQLETIYSELV